MISVIIPAYNSGKVIEDCLKALINQTYKGKYEIIVVDDGSTDNTTEIVKGFKKIRLLRQDHLGPAAARNLGVKKSKGDIILFTDADCVPDKSWLENMVKPFKDKDVAGISGTYRTYNTNSLMARFAGYEIDERHEMLKKEKTIDFIGTFSAGYRRKIFLKFGGFDETFPIASGEDTDMSFKISKSGYKLVFQPQAFVYHKHPDTIKKYLKQKFWRGYWRIPLYKRHKDKLLGHSYTPVSLYISIAMTGAALLAIIAWISGLTSYKLPLVFSTITLASTMPFSIKTFKKDPAVGLMSPIIILLRNLALGFGIVYGLTHLFEKYCQKTHLANCFWGIG